VILIETAPRSIDALRLPFDPITVDAAGRRYRVYTSPKLGRATVIPMSQRLLERIRRHRPMSRAATRAPELRFRTVARMRSGLFLPIFDELSDAATVARLSAEAEEAGWHGVFVWDHLRWREPVVDVADAWIMLAAITVATDGIRLGPMVTPLARRRPVKVAKETATLDRLSGGRLTLGVGLGSDQFGSEFSITGEELDDRRRAHGCSTSLSRSWRPPGQVSPCTTGASTTRSTACGSCRGRFGARRRCGSRVLR
jgi:hypothetical protein